MYDCPFLDVCRSIDDPTGIKKKDINKHLGTKLPKTAYEDGTSSGQRPYLDPKDVACPDCSSSFNSIRSTAPRHFTNEDGTSCNELEKLNTILNGKPGRPSGPN